MSELQTIEHWEEQKGLIIKVDVNLNEKITEEDFDKRFSFRSPDVIGVNHKDRVKFLKDNDYEVTRENMVNGELSATKPFKPEVPADEPEQTEETKPEKED